MNARNEQADLPRWLSVIIAFRPWIALLLLGMGAWAWWALSEIEAAAFRQPTIARGLYLYPDHIKSGVFFLTREQDRLHTVAFWTFFLAWLVGITLLIGGNVLRRRYLKRSQA